MCPQTLMCPGSVESVCWNLVDRLAGYRAHHLVLDRGPHAQRGVSTLAVVEVLEVLEDRIREVQTCPPALLAQRLGLHTPETDSIILLS